MPSFLTILFFCFLTNFSYAQNATTNKALGPEALNPNIMQAGTAEAVVRAGNTFRNEPSLRRTSSPANAKAAEASAPEPNSLRMLAAAVLVMLVIALRRNGSGRP